MDKFTKLTGVAAPLPIINVDTDMIIPKDYLKTIKRTGLGTKGPDGGTITFELDEFRRYCMLNGLDDIGLTMEKATKIDNFEASNAEKHPWA
jgi:3-isopropylmalate dehydratase small subunit